MIIVASYSYNSAGNLTGIDYSDSTPDVSFTYDRLGRQVVAESSVSRHEFTYTGLNLTSESIIRDGVTNVIARLTDTLGRSIGFTVAGVGDPGYSVSYGYDSVGRFASLTSDICSLTSAFTYSYLTNSDLISSLTSDLGPLTSRGYEDHRNLPTQVRNKFGTNLVSQFDYQNDAAGRRTQRIDSMVKTNSFGYDTRSQLIYAIMGTNAFGYAYDPIGNRLWSAANAESKDYSANSLNQYFQLLATDKASASGGTITTTGGYRIHTFTSSGTFEVFGGSLTCDVLVVAGGGGGGKQHGGGGGAGGVVLTNKIVEIGSYTVVVGTGGSRATNEYVRGFNGTNSSVFTYIAYGGGGGGSRYNADGVSGGSGGGSGYNGTPGNGMNGQGSAGGDDSTGSPYPGGGGGGASAIGGNGAGSVGGVGGAGVQSSILGTTNYYGGGGGGSVNNSGTGGAGGLGGGGKGGNGGAYDGDDGVANTGGGGGSCDLNRTPGSGGSGIVIVRYLPSIVTNTIVTNTPTYDADGNLTNDGRFAYSWDCENRMISAATIAPTNGSKKVEYSYDYMSRRVSRAVSSWDGSSWVGQSTNLFVYDGWNLISDTIINQQSAITNSYVWGLDLSGSLQGAGGIGGLLSATFNATNTVLYCYDANGNVTDLVDTNGTSVANYQYDPYGKVVSSSGTMAQENKFRFSTKYWDDETGLGFWGRRYYHPEVGRWMSRDPIGEQGGLNLYVICYNNAIYLIDPLGQTAYAITWRFSSWYQTLELPAFKKLTAEGQMMIRIHEYMHAYLENQQTWQLWNKKQQEREAWAKTIEVVGVIISVLSDEEKKCHSKDAQQKLRIMIGNYSIEFSRATEALNSYQGQSDLP